MSVGFVSRPAAGSLAKQISAGISVCSPCQGRQSALQRPFANCKFMARPAPRAGANLDTFRGYARRSDSGNEKPLR